MYNNTRTVDFIYMIIMLLTIYIYNLWIKQFITAEDIIRLVISVSWDL